jgi:hypothetical protein
MVRNDNDDGYLLRVLCNTFLSTRRAAAASPATEAEFESLEIPDAGSGAARPPAAAEAREVFAAIAALPDPPARCWWPSTSPASPTVRPAEPSTCPRNDHHPSVQARGRVAKALSRLNREAVS